MAKEQSTSLPESPADPSSVPPGFELLEEGPQPGLIRRFFVIQRHVFGVLGGAVTSHVREMKKAGRGHGFLYRLQQWTAFLFRPFLASGYREMPFPIQLRRRLEILGPTFIKLGQVLSLREDLLPRAITDELKNLLDRLPVVPFTRFCELLEQHLGRPVSEMYDRVDPVAIGSASIAQIHRARTVDGDEVVIKMVKPGIRQIIRRDVVLLSIFGAFLQIFLKRFQPRRMIREFCHYTLKEVDLRLEGDNAETFTAAFEKEPDILFPKIYRLYSSEDVLTMEFFDGMKPSTKAVAALSETDRDKVVNLGSKAIIQMLYRDGFFHADLHPGNLIILPGPKVGFIDLGMVGRFDEQLRRNLLYYFYCLVMEDSENAARYLVAVADPAPGANPQEFRRHVEEICRRWSRAASFDDFSLAQLMLFSVGQAAYYNMYFPVEMVLMVKALITYEGVGKILNPDMDIVSVSRAHANSLFMQQFNPLRLAKEGFRGAPDLVDAMIRAPMLITEGLRFLEKTTRAPPQNPLAGLRGALFAGSALVSGALVAATGGPWWLWAPLFVLAFGLILKKPA
jgi:ubiquinone biosynthesis protein